MSANASAATELSVIGDRIDELAGRVVVLAKQLDGDDGADAAASLYEVERALRMAARNLERANRAL
ncbi:MAG TPA: hypothetical protein VGM93_07310 [Acidimicrobiales bacterium]|jgi:hypothetical protein